MWTTRNRTVNLHVCTHYTQTHVVNSNNKSVIKSSICPWENVAPFPSSGLFRITKQLEEVVFVHRVDALLKVKGISALSTQDSKVEIQNTLLSIDLWKIGSYLTIESTFLTLKTREFWLLQDRSFNFWRVI